MEVKSTNVYGATQVLAVQFGALLLVTDCVKVKNLTVTTESRMRHIIFEYRLPIA